MKSIKTLALAGAMALATLAAFGASGASATVICDTAPEGTTELVCPSGHALPSGTVLKSGAVTATFSHLIYPAEPFTCSSSMELRTTSSGGIGSSVSATANPIRFSSCVSHPLSRPCTLGDATNSLQFNYVSGNEASIWSGAMSIFTACVEGWECDWTYAKRTDSSAASPLAVNWNERPGQASGCGTNTLTVSYPLTKEGNSVYLAAR